MSCSCIRNYDIQCDNYTIVFGLCLPIYTCRSTLATGVVTVLLGEHQIEGIAIYVGTKCRHKISQANRVSQMSVPLSHSPIIHVDNTTTKRAPNWRVIINHKPQAYTFANVTVLVLIRSATDSTCGCLATATRAWRWI